MRRSAFILAALAAAAFLLQPAGAHAQTKLRIAFPAAPQVYALPHFVAVEKGFLKEAGLAVEEQWPGGDIPAMRRIATGEADLGIASMPASLAAIGDGAQIRAIGSLQAGFGIQTLTERTAVKVEDLAAGRGFSWILATARALTLPAKRSAMEAYLEQAAIRGSRFVMDHPDEAVAILLRRVPSLDPEVARQAVADLNRDRVWGINGGLDRDVTEFAIKATLDAGKMTGPLTYDRVVDPSLVNAALARIGRRQD